jgi:hypothetical protein
MIRTLVFNLQMDIMKRKLLFSLLLFAPFISNGQDKEFELLPYLNGTTSIKDGLLEIGPDFKWTNTTTGGEFSIRPAFRAPLTNKSANVLQIDRFTSTWRGILGAQLTFDNTGEAGFVRRNMFSVQAEYGQSEFKYYPTGSETDENKMNEASYGAEIKYVGFFTRGEAGARQFSPQFRMRYSYDWKASDKVEIINAPNANGVTTIEEKIIDAPSVKPLFSPAFSMNYYPGKGLFSYAPTLYYDFNGKSGSNDPFDGVQRLRVECWAFIYPSLKGSPNLKIGLSPFMSIRTSGTDKFNKIEAGAMITVKFGTTFLHFF